MFTGIIEATGKILSFDRDDANTVLTIDSSKLHRNVKKGDSVAVDGVCLTVSRKSGKRISFDVSSETIQRTNFSRKFIGDFVNLELPVTANTMLSGHFVQGHVEGIGRVRKWHRDPNDVRLFLDLPGDLLIYCVPKGSISINGVSLTIASLRASTIEIALIPYTLRHTNMDALRIGDLVNIETDVIGRYVVSVLKKTYDKPEL
jgi:riboflavin synthase